MIRRFLADLDPVDRVVLFAVAVLHVTGIGWGLPASDGWDVDGIAPRDFLPGLVETFTPGHYFTYPPLHLALLTLLTLPVTLVQLVRAPSLAPSALVPMFTTVPVMTIFAFVARLTSLVMSLGLTITLGKIAAAIFKRRRAAAWTMAVSGIEAAGTYYAHTTNLDLPALFWGALALEALIRAVAVDDPRCLRQVAVLAACAIATKDQAYALFAVTMPVVFGIWLVGSPPEKRRTLIRGWIFCAAIVVVLVLLLDGALFNPSGFRARLGFLTGPASQDFAQHANTWSGRVSAFTDTLTFLPNHHSVLLIPFFGIGLWLALRGKQGRERIVALIPLLAILSFTLAFNCVARRVEERFVMPQMQLLSVYAGGIALLTARWARGAAGVAMLPGLRLAATIDANMLGDARYDAEAYLREHVAPAATVETYGNNVYLPRFPAAASVTRVGTGSAKTRNPMPGIVEAQDRLGAERSPQWIVVPQGFAWRYLQEDHGPDTEGRVLPKIQRLELQDADTTDYVRALFEGKTGYTLVHRSHYAGNALFPPRPLHASLATDVFVFERR